MNQPNPEHSDSTNQTPRDTFPVALSSAALAGAEAAVVDAETTTFDMTTIKEQMKRPEVRAGILRCFAAEDAMIDAVNATSELERALALRPALTEDGIYVSAVFADAAADIPGFTRATPFSPSDPSPRQVAVVACRLEDLADPDFTPVPQPLGRWRGPRRSYVNRVPLAAEASGVQSDVKDGDQLVYGGDFRVNDLILGYCGRETRNFRDARIELGFDENLEPTTSE